MAKTKKQKTPPAPLTPERREKYIQEFLNEVRRFSIENYEKENGIAGEPVLVGVRADRALAVSGPVVVEA